MLFRSGAALGFDETAQGNIADAVGPVVGDVAFVGALASEGAVGDGDVFEEGIDTTPEYTRWGWWAGEVAVDTYDDETETARTSYARLQLGSWVSGVRADAAEVLNAKGSATYDGLAVGHVIEQTATGPAVYVDGGRFRMEYRFEDREGDVTISDIIGQTVTGTVRPGEDGHQYRGDLGNAGGAEGAIAGDFYRGPDALPKGAQPQGTGGRFGFAATAESGRPASVSGVFAADKK